MAWTKADHLVNALLWVSVAPFVLPMISQTTGPLIGIAAVGIGISYGTDYISPMISPMLPDYLNM